MPLPAANGPTVPLTLNEAWGNARILFSKIQQQTQYLLNAIVAGPVKGDLIFTSCNFFATINIQLTQIAAVPGIAAYAQAQSQALASTDIVAGFNALETALTAVLTWIVTNFPHDVNGNLLYIQFNGQAQTVIVMFTPAQLAPLVALLTAMSATIN